MQRGFGTAVLTLFAVVLAISLLGCGGSGATSRPAGSSDSAAPAQSAPSAGEASGDDGKLAVDVPDRAGPAATLLPGPGWPAGVPSDIPPFPGNAGMVLGQTETERGIWVRIFCNGVSRDQFFSYVAELRAGGYSTRGTVFYSKEEGKAEAERRAAAGDIDEVTATRGNRLLTIGVPKSPTETIAYDMDGLTKAEADAVTGGG